MFLPKSFFAKYPNFDEDNKNISLMHVGSVTYHSNARKLSFSAILCTGATPDWLKSYMDSK
jgi:hypothetical protein